MSRRERALEALRELGGKAKAQDVAFATRMTRDEAGRALANAGCRRIARSTWALPEEA